MNALRPPSDDYPPDEWNVIERRFNPELLAQSETMAALGNGYLGFGAVLRKVGRTQRTEHS
jgi:alpha,alpha-trehalose phosphorylase